MLETCSNCNKPYADDCCARPKLGDKPAFETVFLSNFAALISVADNQEARHHE